MTISRLDLRAAIKTDLPETSPQESIDHKAKKGRGAGRLLSSGNPARARRQKKIKSGPYGLAALVNNCLLMDKRVDYLRNGFLDRESIINAFRKMKAKVNGKRSCLMVNDKGEVMTFPVRSRWNEDFHYGGFVGKKMLDQVRGLKNVTHFILTLDPAKVIELLPDWWVYGKLEFMVIVIGYLVSEFLRKLRQRKAGRHEPWNFITWVLEFHESGMVHVHFMFYGNWVATFEEIHELWGLCEFNGVRFAKRRIGSGTGLCSYLTRYLTKDLQGIAAAKDMEALAAFLWFFRRRLYNFRHMVNGSLGIPGDKYISKWAIYRAEEGSIVRDAKGEEYMAVAPHVRMGKRIDDYLKACDEKNSRECKGSVLN